MSKRFHWVLLGLVIGLAMGGVAYAVVVNPPSSSDRYYACVSPAGVVRSGSIRRNVPPTKCVSATDTIQSWNAVGTTGPTGATGAAPQSSELGTLVGRYMFTTTNSGCGPTQMRVRVVTFSGRAPSDPLGSCVGFPCESVGHDLALGETCPPWTPSMAMTMVSKSCVDLAARLSVTDGYLDTITTLKHSGADDPSTPDVDESEPNFKLIMDGQTALFEAYLTEGSMKFGTVGAGTFAHRTFQACTSNLAFIKGIGMPSLAEVVDPSTDSALLWAVYEVT